MTRIRIPLVWLIIVTFLFNTVISEPVFADVPFLPAPGTMVSLTPAFSPSILLGLKVYKNNPFKFQFVMSQGSRVPEADPLAQKIFLKNEANRLVKYFLAALTVPEKDMWVNLSPYQHDRIVDPAFGITEMGKELLAQDYLLKQLTASVMYPESSMGHEFWNKIYQEAYKRFGTTAIPVNTFNKVWIMPDKATVYENAVDNTAVIIDSRLKVMLEEDYLALSKSANTLPADSHADANRQLSNALIRQIILPQIQNEVNHGSNFANLRQVYNSLILASWFKNKLKQSLIARGYVNRRKVKGVDVADKNVDEEIYRQYLKSYKKGVYNYIKEEMDPATQEVVPRKYFSGGIVFGEGFKPNVFSSRDFAMIARKALGTDPAFVDVGIKGISGAVSIDLTRRVSPRSMFSRDIALFSSAIPAALDVSSSHRLADAAMFGITKKRLMAIATGLALMAAAASAHAKGEGAYALTHRTHQVTVQQAAANPVDIQKENISQEIGNLKHSIEGIHGATLQMNFDSVQETKKEIKILQGQLKTLEAQPSVSSHSLVTPGVAVGGGAPTLTADSLLASSASPSFTGSVLTDSTHPLFNENISNMLEPLNAFGILNVMLPQAPAPSTGHIQASGSGGPPPEEEMATQSEQDLLMAYANQIHPSDNSAYQSLQQRQQTLKAQAHNVTLPFDISAMTHYYENIGTVYSQPLNFIGNGWVANLNVGVPFGDKIQVGEMLAAPAKVSTMGWLYVSDEFMRIYNGYEMNKFSYNTVLFDKSHGLFSSFLYPLVTYQTAYGVDQQRQMDSTLLFRNGLMKMFDNFSLNVIFGHRKFDYSFWPNSNFHDYQYGQSEISFYQNAYWGVDGKVFVVFEHALPQTLDEIKKLTDMFKLGDANQLLKLAKKGGGYAVGLILDPKHPGSIEYGFFSPRWKGDFSDGHKYVVSSNKVFKKIQAQEKAIAQDPKILVFGRDGRTGEILNTYTAQNLPVLSAADKLDPNKQVIESTIAGAQVSYWLHHQVPQDGSTNIQVTVPVQIKKGTTNHVTINVPVPQAQDIPIGIIVNGKSARIYFMSELDAFRHDAFHAAKDRVTYGVNYTALENTGVGVLLNTETGKEEVINYIPPTQNLPWANIYHGPVPDENGSIQLQAVGTHETNAFPSIKITQQGRMVSQGVFSYAGQMMAEGVSKPFYSWTSFLHIKDEPVPNWLKKGYFPKTTLNNVSPVISDFINHLSEINTNYVGAPPSRQEVGTVKLPTTKSGEIFIPNPALDLQAMQLTHFMMNVSTPDGIEQSLPLEETQIAQLMAHGRIINNNTLVKAKLSFKLDAQTNQWVMVNSINGKDEPLELSGNAIARGDAFAEGNTHYGVAFSTAPDLEHGRIVTYLSVEDLKGYIATSAEDLLSKPSMQQYFQRDENNNLIPDGKGGFLKAYHIVQVKKDKDGILTQVELAKIEFAGTKGIGAYKDIGYKAWQDLTRNFLVVTRSYGSFFIDPQSLSNPEHFNEIKQGLGADDQIIKANDKGDTVERYYLNNSLTESQVEVLHPDSTSSFYLLNADGTINTNKLIAVSRQSVNAQGQILSHKDDLTLGKVYRSGDSVLEKYDPNKAPRVKESNVQHNGFSRHTEYEYANNATNKVVGAHVYNVDDKTRQKELYQTSQDFDLNNFVPEQKFFPQSHQGGSRTGVLMTWNTKTVDVWNAQKKANETQNLHTLDIYQNSSHPIRTYNGHLDPITGAFVADTVTMWTPSGDAFSFNGEQVFDSGKPTYELNGERTQAGATFLVLDDGTIGGLVEKSFAPQDVDPLTANKLVHRHSSFGVDSEELWDPYDTPMVTYDLDQNGNILRTETMTYGNLSQYDTPSSGSVTAVDDNAPFKVSDVVTNLNGRILINVNVNIDVNHDGSSGLSDTYMMVKDSSGKVIYKYEGEGLGDQFKPTKVTISHYRGVPGKIKKADGSETYLLNPDIQSGENWQKHLLDPTAYLGEKIDESGILVPEGKTLDNMSINDIFPNQRSIYQGIEHKTDDQGNRGDIHYQEIRNSEGDVIEHHLGEMVNGHFVPNFGEYFFYQFGKNDLGQENLGKYQIATTSMRTTQQENKPEEIVGYANHTRTKGNHIYYRVVQGISNKVLPTNPADVYDYLNNLAFAKDKDGQRIYFKFDFPTKRLMEIKDIHGWLRVIESDFHQVDPRGDLPDGAPDFITFNHFNNPQLDDTPGASVTFKYVEGQGIDESTYKAKTQGVAELDHLTIKKNAQYNIFEYQTHDRRYGDSLINEGFLPNGSLYYNGYKGKPDEPQNIFMYFSLSHELPEVSYGVNEDGSREIWRYYDMNTLSQNGHAYVTIREIDPDINPVKAFIYPQLSWSVYSDGDFLAGAQKWSFTAEKYPGERNIGEDWQGSAPARIIGDQSKPIKEAKEVIAEAELKSGDGVLPAGVSQDDLDQANANRWMRILKNNGLPAASVALFTSAVAALWAFLGKSGRKVNINTADIEELENVFLPDDASRIITYRTARIAIKNQDELAAIIGIPHAKRAIKKIAFINDDSDFMDTDIEALKSLTFKDIVHHPILGPSYEIIADFVNEGFLSRDEIEGIIHQTAERLIPGSMSRELVAAKILAVIFRKAYWEKDGVILKENARNAFKESIKEIYAKVHVPVTNGRIEDIIREIAILRPYEYVRLNQRGNHEGGISLKSQLKSQLWLLDSDLGYRAVSLEDFVLSYKIMYERIPFFATHTPIINWFVRQIKFLVLNGRGAEVPAFIRAHRIYWYQIIKQELNVKLENMRSDLSTGEHYEDKKAGVWPYILDWEEAIDLFSYLMKEDGFGQPLPEVDAGFERRRAVAQQEIDRIYDVHSLSPVPFADENMAVPTMKHITNDIYKGLILHTRGELLKLHRYDLVQGEESTDRTIAKTGYKIRDFLRKVPGIRKFFGSERGSLGVFWHLINRFLLDNRFWSNGDGKAGTGSVILKLFGLAALSTASVLLIPPLTALGVVMTPLWLKVLLPPAIIGAVKVIKNKDTLKAKRGALFWSAVALGSVAFAAYVLSFIVKHLYLMPIPYELQVMSHRLFLPHFTKGLITFLAFIPLLDMTILSFMSIGQAGMALLRVYTGYKYNFYKVKTFPDAMKFLPLVLKDPQFGVDRRYQFRTSIENRYSLRQMDLTTEEYTAFKALLDAIDNDQPLPALPQSLKNNATEQQIKNFVNKFYRRDVASDMKGMNDLISVAPMISGHGEGPYVMYSSLNKKKTKDDVSTQLGMLASSDPSRWQSVVGRLLEEKIINDVQSQEMLGLIETPDKELTSLDGVDPADQKARDVIQEWANMHLQSGYANMRGLLELRDTVYTYYIHKFMTHLDEDEVKREAHNYVQFIFKYGAQALQLQSIFRESTGNKSLSIVDIPDLIREREITIPDSLSPEQRIFLDFVIKNDIYITNDAVSDKNDSLDKRADVHPGKYSGWMVVMQMVRTEILMAMDWDHLNPLSELWFVPRALKKFAQDERLAGGPVNSNIFTRAISSVADTFGFMEEGFLDGCLAVLRELKAVLFYGKGFLRVGFIRRQSMLSSDTATQEDALSMTRSVAHGTRTTVFHEINLEKGLGNVVRKILVPLKKWAGDVSEAIRYVVASKFFLSTKVHWVTKVGALFTWGHWKKKGIALRLAAQVLVIYYVFNLNPWFGMSLSLLFGTAYLGLAITYGGLGVYFKKHGYAKGLSLWSKDMLTKHFPMCAGLIGHMADAVSRGYDGFCKFIRTGGKSDAPGRGTLLDQYIYSHVTIIPGSFLLGLVAISSFDPVKFAAWILPISTVFSFAVFTHILEPLGKKEPLKNVFLNMRNAFLALYLGSFDAVAGAVTGIPFLTKPLRKIFDRWVYQQAYQAILLAAAKQDNKNVVDKEVLDTFAGNPATDSGFHYALRGYIHGKITDLKGNKVDFDGRIKGLPSLIMVLRILYSARRELNRMNGLAVSVPAPSNEAPAQEAVAGALTSASIRLDKNVNAAMQAVQMKPAHRIRTFVKGGIDLTHTQVAVSANSGNIQIAFDDPALLRLLLNADGLAPIIYDVHVMSASQANHFVGLDY